MQEMMPLERRKRECIWLCGRPANTDEDIVSTWLRQTVGKKSSPTSRWGVRNIESISGLDVEYDMPQKDFDALTLRASKTVCRECNNGWMSDLEGAVKDGLLPMVRGERVRLTPSMVARIGTWAAMKSILLDYADRPNHAIQGVDEDARRAFGCEHSPPPNTTVLAAKVEPVELAVSVFTGRVRRTSDHVTRVYFGGFSLRSVAFVTLVGTLHREERAALASESDRFVRAWPYLELVWIDWPQSGPPYTIQTFHHFNEAALSKMASAEGPARA
jgi:hypothetical protein